MNSRVETNTPRVAVVGSGAWGKNLIRNYYELGALEMICEKDLGKLKTFAEQYPDVRTCSTIDGVLEDESVAGVAIATPAETHGQLVRDSLKASKDVFVEKPLCLSTREGRALVDLAASQNQILMVGHVLWYHPAVLKLKELVDSGQIGRIQYVYSNRLNLGKFRTEENILWSFAPHDVSVILGLLNETPDRIDAHGANYLHPRIADVTISSLSFPSGVHAHVFVSWLHPFKEQKLVVVGDRLMAVFDDTEPEKKLTVYPHSIDWKDGVPVARKADGESVSYTMCEPLKAECEHFLECIESRMTPRTDGTEGLRVLQVLETCQQALLGDKQGALTNVADSRDYYVHDSASIDDDVHIGRGTYIWHVSHILKESRVGERCRIGQNVVIGPRVVIGDNVKIQNNVSVYEGVTLENDVFCGPSMVFTNVINPRSEILRMEELRPTLVRRGASLGANSTIMCGITVGQYAFVGAGAVVLRDIPDHGLVVGNPARLIGWMCVCGNRIDVDDAVGRCGDCTRTYRVENDKVELQ